MTDSGGENRVGRWAEARRRYDVQYGIKSHTLLSDLQAFYIRRKGPMYGFRFKDFLDCNTSGNGLATALGGSGPTKDDVSIGTGDGTTADFQLIKKYTDAVVTRTRNITKPVSGTVLVALDGVNQASGWSVNTATGIITFTAAPSVGEDVTAGCDFDVPVRFGEEVDDLLNLTIEDFGSGKAGPIILVEIIDEGDVNDEYYYGGAGTGDPYDPMDADITIVENNGRAIEMNPSSSGYKCKLPAPNTLAGGGPKFFLINKHATNTVDITKRNGDLLYTLPGDTMVTVVLAGTSWYLAEI